MLETFSALLRIAQIEAGAQRSGFAEVDLSALLRSLGETYGAVAEDAQHALETEIAGGVTLTGDRRLLAQMFSNLVENALYHTPAGTGVRLVLRETPPASKPRSPTTDPAFPRASATRCSTVSIALTAAARRRAAAWGSPWSGRSPGCMGWPWNSGTAIPDCASCFTLQTDGLQGLPP